MQAETGHRGALPAATRLREFELLGPILGHGGFGITYLARDTVLDTQVAIKEYVPSAIAIREGDLSIHPISTDNTVEYRNGLQGFLEEAQKLARFHHPNIVGVRRFFEANGTAYIVMEHIDGPTLASVFRREGTLPEARIRDLLSHLLAGLEEVHHAGFLHRDVKPLNIMLRGGRVPVLLDFGSARADLAHRTGSLTAVLTPGFAPIEQYFSGGKQGPWTDIYAAGAVLYRGITRITPHEAPGRVEDDPLVPAARAAAGSYSPALLRAVDWALQVQSRERPQSIAEWRAALGDTGPTSASRPVPPEAPARPAGRVTAGRMKKEPGRRRQAVPIALVAAGIASAAIAAGAWWLSRAPGPAPEPPPATDLSSTPEAPVLPAPPATETPPPERETPPPEAEMRAAWRVARERGTVAAYFRFETEYPNSPLAQLARSRIDEKEEVFWRSVEEADSAAIYRQYIEIFPTGRFIGVARQRANR